VSQWGEVKKKNKDRSRSKANDPAAPLTESVNVPSSRGGRGRGNFESGRGGRGRGSERGRGIGRGGRGTSGLNGNRGSTTDKPSADAVTDGFAGSTSNTQVVGSWDTQPPKAEDSTDTSWEHTANDNLTAPEGQWGSVHASDSNAAAAPEVPKSSLVPDGTRSWASMFAKPAPVPPPSKAPQVSSNQDHHVDEPIVHRPTDAEPSSEHGLPPPAPSFEPSVVEDSLPETPGMIPSEPALNITPSKDALTESNLEQVLDTSGDPPTATAASTIESTQDPRSLLSTPLTTSQQQPISRPPMGGFATSAYKATGIPGRSSSYQRRVMEQQEAVVMPGNHAVDRTTVQFGSLGLNGTADDLDVDEDREEAETRAQPPQHSPIAPRAALPPAPQPQTFSSQQPTTESLPTPRQAPGLPSALQQQPVTQQSPQAPLAPQAMAQQTSQGSYPYNQFSRYSQPPTQQEQPVSAQKPYDAFAQQITQPSTQSPYDGYPAHSQAQVPQPQQPQSQIGGFSSAANDYPSYYTSEQQRNAYQSYYGAYGQQTQQSQTDAGASQQRSGSGFGVSSAEISSQYPTSQAQQSQSRYGQPGEAQTSGHSTPNPTIPGQQHQQLQQSQQVPQQHQGQSTGPGGYPYGHPYYASPYYAAYMNQVSHYFLPRITPEIEVIDSATPLTQYIMTRSAMATKVMVVHTRGRVECTDSLIRAMACLLNPPTTSHLRQPMLADSASILCLRGKVPSAPAVSPHTAVPAPLNRRRANSIQPTAAPSGVCRMSSVDRSRDILVKLNLCINSTGLSRVATTNRKSRMVSLKVRAHRTLCSVNLGARVQRPTSLVNPASLHRSPTRINRRLGVIQAT